MDQNPLIAAGRAHVAGVRSPMPPLLPPRCCAKDSVHKAADLFAARWPTSAYLDVVRKAGVVPDFLGVAINQDGITHRPWLNSEHQSDSSELGHSRPN
jgi:hypothetical protein